jgi:hypothetical protein
MEFFDTATHLRMSSHHVQQIAADLDKARGVAANAGQDRRFVRERHQRVAVMRRTIGTLLVRAGERLSGATTGTVVPDSPRA